VGWTPNGDQLLVDTSDGPELVSLSGAVREFPFADLCEYPCAGLEGYALSPDGQKLAFARGYPDTDNGTVIAIMDLSTGRIHELQSTYATNPPSGVQCSESTACGGSAGAPHWSPDGSRLVFERQHMSPDGDSQWTSAALFVVDADGGNLRRITPPGFFAIDPSWSPDGSLITFANAPFVVSKDRTRVTGQVLDVYTVRADGTQLHQLTNDGDAGRPDWTRDGRIVFARGLETDRPRLWIMDADGSAQVRIGSSLADLSAAGCVACMYPLDFQGGGPADAVWQRSP
jgi:Tol biopolymer transport system component